jgi:hypothetical protein
MLEPMSNPDFDKMKQQCQNQRECMEMLQLIVDGEASPEQKENFFSASSGRMHAMLQKLSPGSSHPSAA